MFARTVETGLHRGDADVENIGNFGVTPALLHKGEQRAVLWAELRERVPERIQFLGINRPGRFGDVFVLVAKGEENSPQLLPPQLVDAGVAREPKQPRFKLGRRLQAIYRPHHLDEDLLGKVLHVIAAAGHGVDESRDPVLIEDDELTLRGFVALLGTAHKVGQIGR